MKILLFIAFSLLFTNSYFAQYFVSQTANLKDGSTLRLGITQEDYDNNILLSSVTNKNGTYYALYKDMILELVHNKGDKEKIVKLKQGMTIDGVYNLLAKNKLKFSKKDCAIEQAFFLVFNKNKLIGIR